MGRNAKLKQERKEARSRTSEIEQMMRQLYREFPPEDLCDDDGYSRKLAEALKIHPHPTSDGQPYIIEGWGQMAMEYIALANRNRSEWQEGLYLLLDGCLSFSMLDWHISDYSQTAREHIRKAGEILNKVGGFCEMAQTLEVWIPREFHRSIENIWDGIGSWKA